MNDITPYPYQVKALAEVRQCLDKDPSSRPCLQLPTGGGKGYVVAFFTKAVRDENPRARIMITVDNQDLIMENYAKMVRLWPNAPCGMYSSGLNRRDVGDPILHVGIQSVKGRARELGHYDYVLIDEAHMVSHKEEGDYRGFLNDMASVNPAVRFIGLTATPWRMGQTGHIAENGAFFTDLIEGATIDELVTLGFLASLHSKHMEHQYDVSGVKKRGGEYIESDLQKHLNTDEQNADVVDETITRAEKLGCKSWIVFCTGIAHAVAICELLNDRGISANVLTGKTPKRERQQMIKDFKAGRFTALVSVEVLIKGFDHPAADLGVMLRPTKSKTLYVQMVGRIMRSSPGKLCGYIFDFAGLVQEHGPVTQVSANYKVKQAGDCPVKPCPECHEIIHLSIMICPECLYAFPPPPPPPVVLSNLDIMKPDIFEMDVVAWEWAVKLSRKDGTPMAMVRYFDAFNRAINEFFFVLHNNRMLPYWRDRFINMAEMAGVSLDGAEGITAYLHLMNRGKPPDVVRYKKDGKYFKVIGYVWSDIEEELGW
jgi:DNA repair protein RadD